MNRKLKSLLKEMVSDKEKKKHKFGAVRTVCLHGHSHDSRKEAMWCLKIHQWAKEDIVRDIICEPVIELVVNGQLICKHLPDFSYEIKRGDGWHREVLDVKGSWDGGKRPEWVIKHRLFCILFPEIKYVVV